MDYVEIISRLEFARNAMVFVICLVSIGLIIGIGGAVYTWGYNKGYEDGKKKNDRKKTDE